MLQVNVARLHEDNREALSLAWVAGREGGTAVRHGALDQRHQLLFRAGETAADVGGAQL